MDWLTVAELADEGSYARGQDYAGRGLVELTAVTADSVSALARGTSTYDVVLGDRTWSCTCPVGIRGDICKHVVATALTAAGQVEPEAPGPQVRADDSVSVVADWLTRLTREAAIDAVRELATHHPDTVDALSRLAARDRGDVTAYASLVDSLKTRRFLDYRDANEHGRHA
ncbi:MAG: hypothetical protein JWO11_824, partial [Nocardioides sp.]|nr:hypothetical protein [Nocardioides sp.]